MIWSRHKSAGPPVPPTGSGDLLGAGGRQYALGAVLAEAEQHLEAARVESAVVCLCQAIYMLSGDGRLLSRGEARVWCARLTRAAG